MVERTPKEQPRMDNPQPFNNPFLEIVKGNYNSQTCLKGNLYITNHCLLSAVHFFINE